MSLKERLVGGDVLDADDAIGLEFDDAVDEQERVAVRQNVADCDVVEDSHGNRYYNRRWTPIPCLYVRASSKPTSILFLKELVECESPSDDAAGGEPLGGSAGRALAASIAKVKTFPGGRFGRNLRCEFQLPGRAEEGAGGFWRSATPTPCGRWAR